MSSQDNNLNIFVSIAAFEDPGLKNTMQNLLDSSDNPENISFGLGLNYKDEPSFDEFTNKIKIVRDRDFDRPGIVKMRSKIRELIEDEKYFLSVDAHTSFAKSWDTKLIDDFEELRSINKKIIISGQISGMSVNDENIVTEWDLGGEWGRFGIMGHQTTIDDKIMFVSCRMVNSKYFLNYYISCNFMFLLCDDLSEIRLPGYHAFPHEEPEQSITSFCNGFDVVAPSRHASYIFLDYDTKYDFPYDEQWWEFVGTDKENPKHYQRRWVLDSDEVRLEVEKLMITGKNKYYSLEGSERTVEMFYKTIGAGRKYFQILCEAHEQDFELNEVSKDAISFSDVV
jgi:hypothetical protein